MRFLFVLLFASSSYAMCVGSNGTNPTPPSNILTLYDYYVADCAKTGLCAKPIYIGNDGVSGPWCVDPYCVECPLPDPPSSSSVLPLLSSSSDNGVGGGGFDNGGVGGSDIVLSAETVDSVIVAFNAGFQSGIAGFAPVVMMAFAILIAVYLFNYAVGRF